MGAMTMEVSDNYFKLFDFCATSRTISATITMLSEGLVWTLTGRMGDRKR